VREALRRPYGGRSAFSCRRVTSPACRSPRLLRSGHRTACRAAFSASRARRGWPLGFRLRVVAAAFRLGSPSTDKFAEWGIVVRIARVRMRTQPAPGGDRSSTPSQLPGTAADSGRDAVRVVRVTRDQLGVVWSADAEPRFWQIVCWDSRDVAVARLKLSGRHRRATFAGLARLQQPFTIAVSGLGDDGSVVWQAGLADLHLRGDRSAGREGAFGRKRTRDHRSTASQERREPVSPKRPKKDPPAGKSGKTSKAKPKKKTARGK
jgi:hypothetical protein